LEDKEYESSWRYIDYIEKIFRRNRELAMKIINKINDLTDQIRRVYGEDHKIKIMNFCGTHEWTIVRYGIRSILPRMIELVAGPGCPVCVTPSYYIERLIEYSLEEKIVVYTFGDVYRLRSVKPVKGAYSLSEAKALGADVRIVEGFADAVKDSLRHERESVFVGIGFETIAPGYARYILHNKIPNNMSFLSLVKLTPPAMFYSLEILQDKPTEPVIAGVIAPGHVSTIIGAKSWRPVVEHFNIPVVVSGFEPIDVLISIFYILKLYLRGEARLLIEYERAVSWDGDLSAQSYIYKVFEVRDDVWRGIGYIPKSGLRLREEYDKIDFLKRHGIKDLSPETWATDLSPGCRCAEIVLGKALPRDCPLFMRKCTPEKPYGPCMVSIEGTCSIWARYGSQEILEMRGVS